MNASPARVIIAVPTFRRPAQLRLLLAALGAMRRPCEVAVLVAESVRGW